MTQYYQCELKEVDGARRTTSWIEERGAEVGLHVEVLEFGNTYFEVERVYLGTALSKEQISEYNRLNRNSLPSIAGNR